jgi:ectoine hydroxylase-related dioxygenase (phytanoyl-CoA dioxygenase family)
VNGGDDRDDRGRLSAMAGSSTVTVPVLDPSAATDAIIDALRRDGAVIIDRLVDPSVMDRVHDELGPHLDATPFGEEDFAGRRTRRTGSLIARSPTFRDLAVHSTVLASLDAVLGDHTTAYQLHLTQVIDLAPGQGGQPVHRDQWAFDFFPFPAGFEVECHTMWAMTDFTEANGATRVIPGSNHWDDKLRPSIDETVPAEMAKGSVLLYVGSVYHGGGANRSDASRLGINVGYTLGWLRQEENQYLACPIEVARTLPAGLARLMGYQRAAYALGYFGDLQDPMQALDPTIRPVTAF